MTGQGAEETRNTISGGTFNAPVVQARDVINPTFIAQQEAAAPVALAQLPALVTGFTGRESELAQIAGILDLAASAGAVVMSVAGLPGVGKTALGREGGHAAHREGWFGGALFIDLHGYDETPLQPAQSLDYLLRVLGVLAQYIPADVEGRVGLYRSVLADISSRVLLIADNASSEAQVRLLLPGSGPHKMLGTSRRMVVLDIPVLRASSAVDGLSSLMRASTAARTAGQSRSVRFISASGLVKLIQESLKAQPG